MEREKLWGKMRGILTALPVLMLSLSLSGPFVAAMRAQQTKRSFTVADDIGFTHFVSGSDPYGSAFQIYAPAQFSPNGELLAVLTARGRLDVNQVEESLRFYRTQDIETFLDRSDQSQPPTPVWATSRLAKKEGIYDYRWLSDSSGVALLEQTQKESHQQIVLADLRKKTTEVLVKDAGSWGDSFDIEDREHYVYVGVEEAQRKEAERSIEREREAERRASIRVFTGSVWDLVLREVPGAVDRFLSDKKRLWIVARGKRTEVKSNGTVLGVSDFNSSTLALAPDGQSMVTKLPVKEMPQSWERLYPPPYSTAPYNEMHAGGSVSQYARIDLKTGSAQSLTDAPLSGDAGWQDGGSPSWSSDGQSVLLPGTFVKSQDGTPARPCIAVVDVATNRSSCMERLRGHKEGGIEFEEGYHYIFAARFAAGDRNLVEIYSTDRDGAQWTTEYRRTGKGDWEVAWRGKGVHERGRNGLEVFVKEGLDQPPVLVASNTKSSRVVWDPNPQFREIELGQARVYKWKDQDGQSWTGGLYLPAHYQEGRRYPLVIQTHGFSESEFLPAGGFPTAFAARELAAGGIAVLQLGSGNCAVGSKEAACNASGYESGVKQLVADGLVDPQNVGYIGFSRTCYYGMKMLTNGTMPLKAALLSDGIMVDYLQFALFTPEEFNQLIGAKPFGDGLETWVKNSPGFHLDKVSAPVLIAVEKDGAVEMWQPYSLLRYLRKPVELQLMNTDEHVITNPTERVASQGLSVDWFRFWMQGYEDPEPTKAEQYKRWRELKKMQGEKKQDK